MNNSDIQHWLSRLWRRDVNLDIDCLRSFMMVADAMSFSRAAETVGRSQSTISQQIAKLEAQVGRPLLSRRKGRVLELTSEGGRLVQHARRILQLNDEAYASMSDDLLTGFVRLGVPLDFFGRNFTVWARTVQGRTSDGRPGGRGQSVGKLAEAQRTRGLRSYLLQTGSWCKTWRGCAARAIGLGEWTKLCG